MGQSQLDVDKVMASMIITILVLGLGTVKSESGVELPLVSTIGSSKKNEIRGHHRCRVFIL